MTILYNSARAAGGTFYRSAGNTSAYLVIGDTGGANGVNGGFTVPATIPSFDYTNYGSWAYDALERITFTPATQVQSVGYKAELYSYSADGYLLSVREAQSSYDYLTGNIIPPNLASALTRSLTSYDAMGRVVGYVEYASTGSAQAGSVQHQRYGIVHDLRGQVIAEKGRTLLAKSGGGFDTLYTHTVNNYSATGLGAGSPPIESAGALGSSTGSILYYSETKNWLNGSSNLVYGAGGFNYSQADRDYADAYTRYSYAFYEAEVQASVTLTNRDGSTSSGFVYDGLGRLSSVSVGGPRAHTLNYVNDINGQVISRSVTGGPGTAKPVQYYHYYNGIMLGANGNNGNDRPDMATALNERIAASPTTPGIFRNGATSPNPYADFDQAYDAVSPETFSGGPSSYTVRGGDSLESIAAQIWGDASLWYMLAEANPSASRGSLTVGTSLIIPNKVANFHNTSDTFRPYDAERAVGDTQPGTPKPPKANKGCGAIGAILIAVIAIAVTAIVTAGIGAIATGASFSSSFSAVLGGSLAGLTGTAAGATALGTAGAVGAGVLGAITGSAISQAFGVATGLQDKFNWKGVALAGLTAGIGGGLDGIGAFARLGVAGTQGASGVFNAVVRAAITNTVTQGVAVATKLQSGFSFTSVAAAGVAAGVASVVSQNIGGAAKYENGKLSQRASGSNRFASGTAGTLAGAATRSVIDGTDFGDNILATLPDIVTSLLSYGLEEVSKPTIIDGVITIGGSVEKDGLPGGCGATAPLTSTTKLGIREDVMHFDIAPAVD